MVAAAALMAQMIGSAFGPAVAAASGPEVRIPLSGILLSAVTADPSPLSPAFSPDDHDYVVRCHQGLNPVTLRLSGTPGGPAGVSSTAVTAPLQENQALVLMAAGPAGQPLEYWIRCLPHDFPQMRVDRPGSPAPGWYVTGNAIPSTDGTSGTYLMIQDDHGTPVWYRPARGGAVDVDLLPPDTIAWGPYLGPVDNDTTYPSRMMHLYQLGTGATHPVEGPYHPTDTHDIFRLANGNLLVLANPTRSGMDVTPLGPAFDVTNGTIEDCVIEELDPNGQLVWHWRASEHIAVAEAIDAAVATGPHQSKLADVYHCDSLDVDPGTGDVLVSVRQASAVYLVDRSTGDVVWKVGGSAFSLDNARILSVKNDPEGGFAMQYDARLEPGGYLSLFDDHSNRTGAARGVEYALDLDAGTASFAWQHASPDGQPSVAGGSFRRYANGTDNVIAWGFRQLSGFHEVDAAGNVTLDVSFPGGEATYRVVKVPRGAIDVGLLRADMDRA